MTRSALRLLIADMIGPLNIEIANAERLLSETEDSEERQYLAGILADLKQIKTNMLKLKGE